MSDSTPSTREPKLRRILAGTLLAVVAAAGLAAADVTSAHATTPPKNCVDDPNQDGCPHDTTGGGETPSPLSRFQFDGNDVWGNFYFSRIDGTALTAYDAVVVRDELSFTACILTWPRQLRIKCAP